MAAGCASSSLATGRARGCSPGAADDSPRRPGHTGFKKVETWALVKVGGSASRPAEDERTLTPAVADGPRAGWRFIRQEVRETGAALRPERRHTCAPW